MNFNEPFPGNYVFLSKAEPTTLEGAARIKVPPRTIEPWQVHYKPFEEKIIVQEGMLFVQYPLWLPPATIIPYKEGSSVSIESHKPHRLINPDEKDLIMTVEYSPGPDYNSDLEPEFSSLNKCVDALHDQLVKREVSILATEAQKLARKV